MFPATPRPAVLGRIALCALLGAGVVGSCVALRTVLLRGSHFSLSEIRMTPLKHLAAAHVVDVSGLSLGMSLFSVDLSEAERRIAREPWVGSVRVRRQLPHTVSVEIVEKEPAIAIQLGSLYLADEAGALFKRASGEEAKGLPVVTGIARSRFLGDPGRARAVVRRAIALDRAWRQSGRSAPLEVHHESGYDAAALFTIVFAHAGRKVGARLGVADASTSERLQRLGTVLQALDAEKAKPELVHLEQRSIDRVAVSLVDGENVGPHAEGGAATASSGI